MLRVSIVYWHPAVHELCISWPAFLQGGYQEFRHLSALYGNPATAGRTCGWVVFMHQRVEV
jgi:hypothetical protein